MPLSEKKRELVLELGHKLGYRVDPEVVIETLATAAFEEAYVSRITGDPEGKERWAELGERYLEILNPDEDELEEEDE